MPQTTIQQREYSINEVINQIYRLGERYEFLDVFPIGQSLLGRPILATRIGARNNNVLYVAGFHGSERLTVLLMLIFLEEYCNALENNLSFTISSARNALFGKSIIVVPCINPDGYEISRIGSSAAGAQASVIQQINGNNNIKYWNANARGVDINHNFDAGFDLMKEIERADGITGPSPRRYGGPYPESEPETQALVRLCRENYIALAMAWHSQGEEIYWQYGENTPERCLLLAQLFSTASGYRVAEPAPSASHAGFKDWFINEFSRSAFTIEIGKGVNPLDPTQLYAIYGDTDEMMLLSIALA